MISGSVTPNRIPMRVSCIASHFGLGFVEPGEPKERMEDRDLYRPPVKLFDLDQDRWLSRGLEEDFPSLISLIAGHHLKDRFAELILVEFLDSVEILASEKRERLVALFSDLGFDLGVIVSIFVQIDRPFVDVRECCARLGGHLLSFPGHDYSLFHLIPGVLSAAIGALSAGSLAGSLLCIVLAS